MEVEKGIHQALTLSSIQTRQTKSFRQGIDLRSWFLYVHNDHQTNTTRFQNSIISWLKEGLEKTIKKMGQDWWLKSN